MVLAFPMMNLVSRKYLQIERKVRKRKFRNRNNLVATFVKDNLNEKFLLILVSATFLVQKLNWCLT